MNLYYWRLQFLNPILEQLDIKLDTEDAALDRQLFNYQEQPKMGVKLDIRDAALYRQLTRYTSEQDIHRYKRLETTLGIQEAAGSYLSSCSTKDNTREQLAKILDWDSFLYRVGIRAVNRK